MRAILDRIEGNAAVLRTDDKQELVIPKTELPKGSHEGSVLFVLFSQDTTEEKHREKLAKSILNEILKTTP